MSIRLAIQKRNFELEKKIHTIKSKRIQDRDDPLTQMRNEERENRLNESGEQIVDKNNKGDEEDQAAAAISHKLG